MGTRISELIRIVRLRTENESFSDTTGILDDEFISYANDAQERLQSLISGQHNKIFTSEARISTVANQASYDLPADIYLDNRVSLVEYTSTSNDQDLWLLKKARLAERINVRGDHPMQYIVSGGKLILSPIPQTSRTDAVRITYIHKLAKLNTRRGTMTSRTVNSLGGGLSEITKIGIGLTSDIDQDALEAADEVSFFDRTGTIKVAGVIYGTTTVTATELELNITNPVSYVVGSAEDQSALLVANETFVTIGAKSTSHTPLAEIAERYIVKYMESRILGRDSNVQETTSNQELIAMERDIVAAYAEVSDDVDYVADINQDMFEWYEW